MSIWVCLAVALGALRANALRTFLAMLGIIIGVASVIVMVSISTGAQRQVANLIESLGANQLIVTPGASRGARRGPDSAKPFSDEDAERLKQLVPDILAVATRNSGSAAIVEGSANWTTRINATNADYFEVRSWRAAEGRLFTEGEVRAGARVVVLGKSVVTEVFGGGNPLGRTVRIGNVPFQVIGVLEEKGQSAWGSDQDDIAIMPITTARKRLFGAADNVRDAVERMEVALSSRVDMTVAQADVESALRVIRDIRPGAQDDFRVRNIAEFIRARNETQATLGILLAATAAIALVVGGIGIMNIMLVSVTERTREIGLRIAVGAKKRDIRNQFLIEAVALCMLGGLIGLAAGAGVSIAMSSVTDWPMALDLSIALIAMGSSAGVGIFFGFYPARQAAKLNPIDALRFE